MYIDRNKENVNIPVEILVTTIFQTTPHGPSQGQLF